MDIQKQAVKEYLMEGYSYRALAEKYNVSRSTINKWVLVYQGIHNIPRSHKQISFDLQQKTLGKKSKQPKQQQPHQNELEKKIALLEKQLEWEKLKSHALDTMISVAERELNIDIRKKHGTKQSEK